MLPQGASEVRTPVRGDRVSHGGHSGQIYQQAAPQAEEDP